MISLFIWTTLATLLSCHANAKLVCGGTHEIGIGYSELNSFQQQRQVIFTNDCKILASSPQDGESFCSERSNSLWPAGYNVQCSDASGVHVTTPNAKYANCYDPTRQINLWNGGRHNVPNCDGEQVAVSFIEYCCQEIGNFVENTLKNDVGQVDTNTDQYVAENNEDLGIWD